MCIAVALGSANKVYAVARRAWLAFETCFLLVRFGSWRLATSIWQLLATLCGFCWPRLIRDICRVAEGKALAAAIWLQGPCPPTIAGRAASTSLKAPWRHPCRQRSRDGERARASRVGRCGWASNAPRRSAIHGARWRHLSLLHQRLSDANADVCIGKSARAPRSALSSKHRPTSWRGVPTACGTVWRHGCRHRASTDGFTACPGSGEGTAPSTSSALAHPFDSRLKA
ncbi:hypothetical protein XBLMG947_0689 [Xanthomonas bromi]|uniref:Uncharacterized protein n=1 Tax=Xanthomonas bromi TaxID=56449 RepID=A0A1C3NHP4_9XANT|nr:hypothetical protein XBLMG947_0689 [Xanthomonas bromi]